MPFVFLRLLWRSRRVPEYRKRWAERLGHCPYRLEKSIWVHAVSVGETLAAVPLIKALLQEFPQCPLVVTNMTPTGALRVKAALQETVKQVYVPYDVPKAVGLFLKRINPQIAIVMETELWPNLFASCHERHIPVVVLNARLSQQSARGYGYVPHLTRTIFTAIHHLAAQTAMDAERFIKLGLSPEKVTVTGNLKFDLELPADLSMRSEMLRNELGKERPIWIAASTHQGEEEIALAAHRLILKKYPSALLILVPRHPDRFAGVASLVKQQGFHVVRRSSSETCSLQTQVYLGDTMGELLLLYAAADVAFVAGSFAQVGGHNMLEPAALRKPIVTGPVLFNFVEISRMLVKAKGMIIVQNPEALAQEIERFFANQKYRDFTGGQAYQVVHANRGALQKQEEIVKAVLKSV